MGIVYILVWWLSLAKDDCQNLRLYKLSVVKACSYWENVPFGTEGKFDLGCTPLLWRTSLFVNLFNMLGTCAILGLKVTWGFHLRKIFFKLFIWPFPILQASVLHFGNFLCKSFNFFSILFYFWHFILLSRREVFLTLFSTTDFIVF